MALQQRIFLTKRTLPFIQELLEQLDRLPRSDYRGVYLLFYSGFAVRRLEEDRVTEGIMETLPGYIKTLLRSDWNNWRSERKWMETVRAEADLPQKITLKLLLTDANIGRIESMSCEELLAQLEARTRAAYSVVPGRRELCEGWGDESNTRVYMFRHEMERKWLDNYLRRHPAEFERELL
jgi:hypothetical protein